ncbi:MAG: MFS transporter [Thermoflexales bacterium]|nr:MFS transporter [Thermoflexales bacterium]
MGAFALLRFAGDTSVRAPIPYIIFIAAAFGAPPESSGWLAVALGLTGLVSPLVAAFEHRIGARRTILLSVGLFASGCFALALAPSFPAVLILCVVLSLGRSLVGPQAQAFVADTVPFDRRGTVLGVLELAWALAWIIGVPAFGVLLQRVVWWAPFWALGVIALLGAAAVLRFALTTDHTRAIAAAASAGGVREALRNGQVRRLLAFGSMLMVSIQLVVVVYSPHLVARFGLNAEQIGLASLVLGLADILAELLIIFALDRIGKRRSVLGGLVLMAVGVIAFLLVEGTLAAAIAALFLVFLGFEYAIVSSLPIMTEIMPTARTAVAGSFNAANSVGRTLAAFFALPLYRAIGLNATYGLALVALAVTVVLFTRLRVRGD